MKASSVFALCVFIGVASSLELSLARYRRRGSVDGSPHIIGGVEAARGAWPWQGSILDLFETHTCGCVLLSTKYVLTAGHCVQGIFDVDIWLGIHDQLEDEGQVLEVAAYNIHPDMSLEPSEGFPNDIAVLELDGEATIGGAVQAARLPASASDDFTSSECFITGWGLTDEDIFPPAVLMQAKVDCLTTEECQQKFDGLGITVPISNVHQCVWDKTDGSRGACSGDSGGPLNCKDAAGEWVVAGITSWGLSSCDPEDAPSVYTRTATFLDWINGIISG